MMCPNILEKKKTKQSLYEYLSWKEAGKYSLERIFCDYQEVVKN